MKQKIYTGEKKRNLYIMRGLQGSGKSTLAKEIGGIILSADDFHMKDGKYCFSLEGHTKAHPWNIQRARTAMGSYAPRVIIDNTNTQAWEIKAYVEIGIKNEYDIFLVEPNNPNAWDIDYLVKNNSHDVPRGVIEKYMQRYEHNLTLEKILNSERFKR